MGLFFREKKLETNNEESIQVLQGDRHDKLTKTKSEKKFFWRERNAKDVNNTTKNRHSEEQYPNVQSKRNKKCRKKSKTELQTSTLYKSSNIPG